MSKKTLVLSCLIIVYIIGQEICETGYNGITYSKPIIATQRQAAQLACEAVYGICFERTNCVGFSYYYGAGNSQCSCGISSNIYEWVYTSTVTDIGGSWCTTGYTISLNEPFTRVSGPNGALCSGTDCWLYVNNYYTDGCYTLNPTLIPTNNPTKDTELPTITPSWNPSTTPTMSPSTNPTNTPTNSPTNPPSMEPTISTLTPTINTSAPTPYTNIPTTSPTLSPTYNPTITFDDPVGKVIQPYTIQLTYNDNMINSVNLLDEDTSSRLSCYSTQNTEGTLSVKITLPESHISFVEVNMKPPYINLIGSATFMDLDDMENTIKSFETGLVTGFDNIIQTGFTQFQLLPQETSNKLNTVRIHTNEINITINFLSSMSNIDICGIHIYGLTLNDISSINNPSNNQQSGLFGITQQHVIFIAFGGIVLILILCGLFIILFFSKKNRNLRKQVLILQPDSAKDLYKVKTVSSDDNNTDEKSYTIESIQKQIIYLESLKLKLTNQNKTIGEGTTLNTKRSETIDKHALPTLPSDGVSRHKSTTSQPITIDDDSDDIEDIFGRIQTKGE